MTFLKKQANNTDELPVYQAILERTLIEKFKEMGVHISFYNHQNENPQRSRRISDLAQGKNIGFLYPNNSRKKDKLTFNFKAFLNLEPEQQVKAKALTHPVNVFLAKKSEKTQ